MFQNDRKIMIIQFVQKVLKTIFKIKLLVIDNLLMNNPNQSTKIKQQKIEIVKIWNSMVQYIISYFESLK